MAGEGCAGSEEIVGGATEEELATVDIGVSNGTSDIATLEGRTFFEYNKSKRYPRSTPSGSRGEPAPGRP